MNDSPSGRSSRRMVRRNALWNIVGQGLPFALAIFCIPKLIAGIGTDRFGALTLVWTFLTYFSLFDLGLGRALTQMLAKIDSENRREESEIIWTASFLLGALGILAALILFFCAPLFALRVLRLKGEVGEEMTLALRELAVVLPLLIHGLALKGILEAKRRFDLSNAIRIPLGIFTYGAPLLVLPFSRSLSTVVAVLLAGRVVAWALNLWMVFRILPHVRTTPSWRPQRLQELLRFGGWVTLSSIIAPIIDSLDRFLIGALLSISMVAYYTTSYEVASKLWVISIGIGGAMFPELVARLARDRAEAQILYMRGFKYLLAILFPIVLFATVYAREGLSLWLNPEFARIGGPVLQWLMLTMLIGGVAQVPYFLLLAAGRPRIPAISHLLQLPFYAGLLYFALKIGGVRGAAAAYALRTLADFLILFFFSGALLKFRGAAYRTTLVPFGIALGVLLAFQAEPPLLVKSLLALAVLAVHACIVWFWVLEAPDKNMLLSKLGLGPKGRAA